jgi:hypothetical protein
MKQISSILVISLSAALLSSCATPGDLTRKPPVVEYDSHKQAREVASCISKKWADHSSMITSLITDSGYSISLQHPAAGTDATAVIETRENGCHVRYSERISWLSPEWMSKPILDCK